MSAERTRTQQQQQKSAAMDLFSLLAELREHFHISLFFFFACNLFSNLRVYPLLHFFRVCFDGLVKLIRHAVAAKNVDEKIKKITCNCMDSSERRKSWLESFYTQHDSGENVSVVA